MTNIPDDGTLAWYLHDNMGKPLTPAICQEITNRSQAKLMWGDKTLSAPSLEVINNKRIVIELTRWAEDILAELSESGLTDDPAAFIRSRYQPMIHFIREKIATFVSRETPGSSSTAYLFDNRGEKILEVRFDWSDPTDVKLRRDSSVPTVEPAPPKRVWGSEQEVFEDLLALVTSDPDTIKLWLDPISWHFPVKNGRIDHDAPATAGSLMDLGRSVRNYYGMWDDACPFTEIDSDRLKIENGIIVDERHPDNVSDRIIKRVLVALVGDQTMKQALTGEING